MERNRKDLAALEALPRRKPPASARRFVPFAMPAARPRASLLPRGAGFTLLRAPKLASYSFAYGVLHPLQA